jgi:hypothetical protein
LVIDHRPGRPETETLPQSTAGSSGASDWESHTPRRRFESTAALG